MKKVKINAQLMKDVMSICNSIYRMNACSPRGYLFNPTSDRHEIEVGMFCDRDDEINPEQWVYYYDFKTETVYKID
jgi:hypothetical protein